MTSAFREFKSEVKKHLKQYTTFLRGLHSRKITGLNAKLNRFHKEAYTAIDCGQCANCCKTMTPTYTKADVKRIARHVGLTPQAYWKKYLAQDESGDIIHRKTPCHFLDKNNRCSIYEVRPQDCRLFPHTQRKDFLYQRQIHLQNLDECPITHHVVKRMHEDAGC
jgi:Fe-S-cluster containining protein